MVSICVVCSRFAKWVIRYLQERFPEVFPSDASLELYLLDTEHSSFLSDEVLLEVVRRLVHCERFDFVVLPRVEGLSHVQRVFDVNVVSLKHVSDVPALLWYLTCERSIPDDVVEFERRLMKYRRLVEERVYTLRHRVVTARYVLGRKYRRVLTGMPPLIAGEVNFATKMPPDEFLKVVERYVQEGVDIVDIGCCVGDPRPDRVRELVRLVQRNFPDVLISVDTFTLSEIEAAVQSSVDLVLSLTYSKLRELKFDISDTGIVLIPEGCVDLTVYYRSCVEECMKRLAVPILDPLVKPPLFGLATSLADFLKVRKEFPNVPLLAGIGNVTELIDADSHGVNALLAALMVELEVDILLTTEASRKTEGCIREVKDSVRMCTIAKLLCRYPKDLSISLLVVKSKY